MSRSTSRCFACHPTSPATSITAAKSADAHYAARENVVAIPDPHLGRAAMPGIVPKLSRPPGAIQRPAPVTGEHNAAVFGGLLAISAAELAELHNARVI